MRLILVRHPLPAIAAGLCYGSSDVAVDPAALHAALPVLASAIAPLSELLIYSSPLRRCTALSIPLAARLGAAAPVIDARLAEMHFGDWEMRPWDSIARADVDAWSADLVHHAPGGGETVLQVAARVAAFLDDLRNSGSAGAIVVCHAGTIRLLRARQQAPAGSSLADIALLAATTPHRVDYAGVVLLQF